jgi:hypothetical protein
MFHAPAQDFDRQTAPAAPRRTALPRRQFAGRSALGARAAGAARSQGSDFERFRQKAQILYEFCNVFQLIVTLS